MATKGACTHAAREGTDKMSRVLTVGSGDRGGILEALQRCINLEHVSDVLCALDFTLIP